MKIIIGFLPKMNGHRLQWNIEPTLSSPLMPSFDSDVFNIGLPNVLFLRLQSLSVFNSTVSKPVCGQNNLYSTAAAGTVGFGGTANYAGGFGGGLAPAPATSASFNFGASSPSTDDEKGAGRGSGNGTEDGLVVLLMSFPVPPSVYQVIVHFEIYCHEIDCHFAGIWNLGNQHCSVQRTPTPLPLHSGFGTQSANNMKLQSVPWTLPRSDVVEVLADRGLSFECTLNVLKVVTNSFSNGFNAGFGPSVQPLPASSSWYVYQCDGEEEASKGTLSPIRFLWEITESQLFKLERWEGVGDAVPMNALQINSNVFGGMFQLKLWRSKEQSNPRLATSSGLRLWISLCGIPKGTDKMGVKFQISVLDSSRGHGVVILSQVITFSYQEAVFELTERQNCILRQMVTRKKGLRLLCKAVVIQKVDNHNNLVHDRPLSADRKSDEVEDDHNEMGSLRPTTSTKRAVSAAKMLFVEMEREQFLWKISNWKSMEMLRTLRLDEYFESDPFILWGHKWYLSVSGGNSVTRTAGWNHNNGFFMNNAFGSRPSNNRSDTLAVHLNPLLPTSTIFDCRVRVEIVQTGCHVDFYRRYQGVSTQSSSIRQQRNFVMQSIADLKGVEGLDIMVSMERVNEMEMWRESGQHPLCGVKQGDTGKRVSDEVGSWLTDTVKLPEYQKLFGEHELNELDVVRELTVADMLAMGIVKVGHQIRLRKAISEL